MQEEAGKVEPVFARQASTKLAAGDREGALALAQSGVELYPWYPTGLLVLSRCYEAAGHQLDALLAMRKVEAILPDAPLVMHALARLELSQAQSYEQSMTAEEPAHHEQPEEPKAVPEPPPETGPGIEELAQRLQTAGPIKPELPLPDKAEEAQAGNAPPPSIISPTVAEIFMQQGEYGEALRTYRKIVSQHPEEYAKYSARMEEIEAMIRKQIFE